MDVLQQLQHSARCEALKHWNLELHKPTRGPPDLSQARNDEDTANLTGKSSSKAHERCESNNEGTFEAASTCQWLRLVARFVSRA